jgi:membrane fusion protein (multidrug efflux system)
VDEATLNLGYTRIAAPLEGLVGVNKVKPGNLVGRGENTLLTTISEIDPMDVQISISESDYLLFSKEKAERKAEGEKNPDFPIQLILADGSIFPYPGKLHFLERAVDPTTGTLSVRLSFPNPDKILRPGQYGKVRAVGEVKKGAILIPQRAVMELQGIFRVAVVGPDDKVIMKTVTVGDRFGNLWQITSELNAGETVVVEGLQKIKDGTLVAPTLFQKSASENTVVETTQDNAEETE